MRLGNWDLRQIDFLARTQRSHLVTADEKCPTGRHTTIWETLEATSSKE
jgi:hypothetical protein